MGKTYERIGSNRLYSFMEQNGLLSPFQYAYRKNKDLTQALLYYVLEAQQAIDSNHVMLTTMVDLEGAYDCVWRAGLLKKLYEAGIRGRLYMFIQQYLTGRTVKSTVNQHTSKEFTTKLGLPQGGIIVVFCFIFYITDMTNKIPNKIGFADDLNAWEIHKDVLTAIRKTKTNCEELIRWCRKWRMLINWGKTFFMLHQPRRQQKLQFSFKVGTHRMQQVHSARCLGFILDEDMNFKDHIDTICSKAQKAIYKMNMLNDNSRIDVAILMYKAMVRAQLERTYPIWCTAQAKLMDKVTRIHRLALLKATGAMSSTSTAALEIITHTLPIAIRLDEVLQIFYIKLLQKDSQDPLLKIISTRQAQATTCRFLTKIQNLVKDLPPECLNPAKLVTPLAIYQRPMQRSPEILIPENTHGSSSNRTASQKLQAKSEALQRIRDLPIDQPVFFTDGSALGNPGPCGAGVVLYKNGMNSEPVITSIPVANPGTSYLGELAGIESALETSVSLASTDITEINILVDCTSAILSTCNPPEEDSDHCKTIEKIRESVHRLHAQNITTKITWIPGHVDLHMNELADKAAKEGAEQSSTLITTTSNHIGIIRQHIRSLSRRKWQSSWNVTSSHTELHHHRPRIPTGNYKSVAKKAAERNYVRLVTGHNRLKTRMHRLKLADTPNCECTLDRQTDAHILMSCPLYTIQRNALIDKVERIYQAESTPLHQRSLTANTLMHPKGPTALRQQVSGAVMMYLQGTGIQL